MFQLNPNDFSKNTFLGQLIRIPLALIPKNTVIPILQGSAKGIKWIVGSGLHSMWMGLFEIDKQLILQNFQLSGTTVVDIGANVGFFTILLSRLVGNTGFVIAFEPLTRDLEMLYRHIHLNNIKNVTVYGSAVAEKEGVMRFNTSMAYSQSHLSETGDIEVQVVTLDSLLDNFKKLERKVSLLKIDVEGAEDRVLEGGKNFFSYYRPVILLATHGEDKVSNCRQILSTYGYSLMPLDKMRENSNTTICEEWIAEFKDAVA
ncbi:FkbM family methyltransferase [Nostoc sp.]|uniref:FkbM family methyltransferase n=1 Tax=Nostoc sp. TaxID=1180 RepID=UPI002FFCEB07